MTEYARLRVYMSEYAEYAVMPEYAGVCVNMPKSVNFDIPF